MEVKIRHTIIGDLGLEKWAKNKIGKKDIKNYTNVIRYLLLQMNLSDE
jgi:hypothetical protein